MRPSGCARALLDATSEGKVKFQEALIRIETDAQFEIEAKAREIHAKREHPDEWRTS